MSKFTARIQLHKAEEKDYETLNREIGKDPSVLKKKNLSVRADKIKKGEYDYRGNITRCLMSDFVMSDFMSDV